MTIELVEAHQCAIPVLLAPSIDKVVVKVGVSPISVCRAPEAAPILNRQNPPKHTQLQIFDATSAQRIAWGIVGTPNRPGTSTHECRSDAVAYPGPAGRVLEDWQCGMDWPFDSIAAVMAAFREIGEIPMHPYPSGNEYHHVNLAGAPPGVPPTLRGGMSGSAVFALTSMLQDCGYLTHRGSYFSRNVVVAVEQYQGHHHLQVDGVVGLHTWANLKMSLRWCELHHRTEV